VISHPAKFVELGLWAVVQSSWVWKNRGSRALVLWREWRKPFVLMVWLWCIILPHFVSQDKCIEIELWACLVPAQVSLYCKQTNRHQTHKHSGQKQSRYKEIVGITSLSGHQVTACGIVLCA